MHPTFQISPQQSRTLQFDQCRLVIDAGSDHFCFTVQIMDTREFVGLEYYQFKDNQQDDVAQLLQNHSLLQMNYGDVQVYYHGRGGLLVPELFFRADQAAEWLDVINGDFRQGLTMLDAVPDIQAKHIYNSIEGMHEMIAEKFVSASFSHFNTGWIKKKFKQDSEPTVMELVLYPSHIVVALWREGQLLLIQHYDYDTPEDVAWWLLNLTRQWNVNPEEIPVRVSGLLETQSPMFAEIQKYFLHVELDTRPAAFQYDFTFDNYPQHFFSPVFSLALCGS